MDRIHTNRTPGYERVHVEIAAGEIADLLDDLRFPVDGVAFEATRRFKEVLMASVKDLDLCAAEPTTYTTEER